MPQEYRLILKNADQPGYTPDIECYLRHGGYEALKKALRLRPKTCRTAKRMTGPEQIREEVQTSGLARPRRRGIFLRLEMVVRGSQERQADLPDLQRGRIRAGHVQGSADHSQRSAPDDRRDDHLLLRERREARLHLHPRRICRRRANSESRPDGSAGEEFPRAKIFSAAVTIWKSTCIAARALTFAARKPA